MGLCVFEFLPTGFFWVWGFLMWVCCVLLGFNCFNGFLVGFGIWVFSTK